MGILLIIAIYIVSFAMTMVSPWALIVGLWIFDALIRIRTNKIFLLMMLRPRGRIFALGLLFIVHIILGWVLFGIVHLFK